MDAFAALLILALAALAGMLLYLPFFLLFRSQGSGTDAGETSSLHVTGAGLAFYGAMLLVLFAGLAAGTLRPASWFGAQVGTLFGGLGYSATVTVLGSLVERALVRRGARFWRRVATHVEG